MSAYDRYWDTGPFLALLKQEPHRIVEVAAIVQAAEAGRLNLVTSSATLVEVIKLDRKNAVVEIPETDATKIRRWFLRSFIHVRTLDRQTAEIARELIWRHGLSHRDGIQLATAVRWRMRLVETTDAKDLISLSGKVGDPPIVIRAPLFDLPAIQSDPAGGGALQMEAFTDE